MSAALNAKLVTYAASSLLNDLKRREYVLTKELAMSTVGAYFHLSDGPEKTGLKQYALMLKNRYLALAAELGITTGGTRTGKKSARVRKTRKTRKNLRRRT